MGTLRLLLSHQQAARIPPESSPSLTQSGPASLGSPASSPPCLSSPGDSLPGVYPFHHSSPSPAQMCPHLPSCNRAPPFPTPSPPHSLSMRSSVYLLLTCLDLPPSHQTDSHLLPSWGPLPLGAGTGIGHRGRRGGWAWLLDSVGRRGHEDAVVTAPWCSLWPQASGWALVAHCWHQLPGSQPGALDQLVGTLHLQGRRWGPRAGKGLVPCHTATWWPRFPDRPL